MAWYAFMPTWRLLFLPVFVLLAFIAALGPGLLLTALSVEYRDFRYVVPFIIQIGMFVSPVGYPSSHFTSMLPAQWQWAYSLNPMVGVIEGFRWSILGGQSQFNPYSFLISLGVAVYLLLLGITSFRRMERRFADII
jgi:lipopolysaccharide transport system permease protein